MKFAFRHVCVGMMGLAFACSTQAALIVNWGGDTISANQLLAAGIGNNKGGFAGGNPLQLSPTSGYSGGIFYGNVNWTTPGADGNYGQMLSNGISDRLEIKRYNTDLQAIVLWKQANFLNGLNTGVAAFDATSTVSMNLNTFVNFSPGRVVIRLQGGSQDGYYISQETPFNGTGSKSANPAALTWLSYDPANDLATFGSSVNLLSGGLINNITEVGFYFRSNNATSPNAVRLDSFQATAVEGVIPEPASLTLIGASGLMLLPRRR